VVTPKCRTKKCLNDLALTPKKAFGIKRENFLLKLNQRKDSMMVDLRILTQRFMKKGGGGGSFRNKNPLDARKWYGKLGSEHPEERRDGG